MTDTYKISKALEDLKKHYGLKEIKNVQLNMNDPENTYITFISNRPNLDLFNHHDKHTMPENLRYKLTLSIMNDRSFPEE